MTRDAGKRAIGGYAMPTFNCSLLKAGALGLVLMTSLAAYSQPASNTVGIYFDEAALTNEAWANINDTVHCYLVATGLDAASPITGWWGGLVHPVPTSYVLRGGGANSIGSGTQFNTWFDVALTEPMPVTQAIVLADLYCEVTIGGAIGLAVDNVYSSMNEGFGCATATNGIQLAPSTGCPDVPCLPAWVATINGAGPVAIDNETWGGVKAQFR